MTKIHVRQLAVTQGLGGFVNTPELLRKAIQDAVSEGHDIIGIVPGFTTQMRGDTTIEYIVISSTVKERI